MKFLILLLLNICLASQLLSSENLWKNHRRFMPTKSLATAGSQNIGADKTDAAYLNPATLITKDKKYMISFNTLYTDTALPTQFMLSAVDSRTSSVAGGAYVNYYNYSKKIGDKEVNYNRLQVGLSYAYPLMGDLVAGIGGKYIKYGYEDSSNHKVTFDIGLTYRISQYIKVGVVGYNLADIEYEDTPLSVVSGVSIGDSSIFLFNFDFVADFSAPDLYNKNVTAMYEYHMGAQVSPFEGFSLLGGYEINQVIDDNFWSLGLEWFIPETRAEFTFAYLQSTSKSNKYFSFDIKLYF